MRIDLLREPAEKVVPGYGTPLLMSPILSKTQAGITWPPLLLRDSDMSYPSYVG
jgi:hypothetical protein